MTKFALFLKKSREAQQLSQSIVANTLGYGSPQFVSNWERGLSEPPMRFLSELAELYGIDSDDLKARYIHARIDRFRERLTKQVWGS